MKRLSTIFTVLSIIALSIIGCSKDDGGSDNNGNNSGNGTGSGNGNSNSGQTVTAITPDFLNGTWSVVEFEYDGVKFSNNANYRNMWNCIKQTTYVFTKTQITINSSQYDTDDNTCKRNTASFNYTVTNNKLSFMEGSSKRESDLAKEGNNFTLSIKDDEGKTQKFTFSKSNANGNNGGSNNEIAKKATAKITVSGVTNGVKVIVATSTFKSSHVAVKEATVSNGSATIDVSEYIGRKLYFIVEKDNEYLSTEVEKTIAEGDNTIALTATAKDYTVKIKVVSNGTAVSGKKVYAADSYTFQALSYGLKTGNGNENLLTSTKNATTNAQGIATFSNFRPTYNNQKYTFFVVTSSSPYYKEVELAIDGTAKESTITLAGSQAQTRKVNVEFLVRDSNEYLNNVKITIEGQTKSTNTIGSVKGYVIFELEQNKSFSYTATTPCGHTKTGSFTTNAYSNMVQVTLNTTENCNNQAKGTLIIKNTSKNPYTVKVGSSTFIMEGKTTRTFEVALETYTVSWKQNKGYAFYPTEGSYDAEFSRNNREITVSFP